MPFSSAFETHPIVERLQRVRRNPIAAYGSAVVVVALAVLVRWAVGDYVGARIPFITFYPAIIIATLVGGVWPGIFATILSSLAAWYLFLTPEDTWILDERELIQLLLFIFICGINLTIVTLMNALVDRVFSQEENMRVLLESAPNGIIVVDEHGTIKLVNASTEKLFGYKRLELLGRNVEVLVPDRQVETHRAERNTFQRNPEARSMGAGRDLSGKRKDGSEFPLEIGLNPVESDANSAILATVIDISERKRAQARQQLLTRELQHRAQNLLAVIQGIAKRSLSLAAEREVFNARLMALGRANAMLAEAAWEGAPLAEILQRQFTAFSQQLTISGCDIVLSPAATQQFALIVHELATNAIKYGALSLLGGRILIEGKIEGLDGARVFSFVWREAGGPAVLPPTRRGFGSTILLDSTRAISQKVAMNFTPQGLSYELTVPLSAITATKNSPADIVAADAGRRGLADG